VPDSNVRMKNLSVTVSKSGRWIKEKEKKQSGMIIDMDNMFFFKIFIQYNYGG